MGGVRILERQILNSHVEDLILAQKVGGNAIRNLVCRRTACDLPKPCRRVRVEEIIRTCSNLAVTVLTYTPSQTHLSYGWILYAS
jgi:hypothetical protein